GGALFVRVGDAILRHQLMTGMMRLLWLVGSSAQGAGAPVGRSWTPRGRSLRVPTSDLSQRPATVGQMMMKKRIEQRGSTRLGAMNARAAVAPALKGQAPSPKTTLSHSSEVIRMS